MSENEAKPGFDRDKVVCEEIISTARERAYPMQESVFVRELLPMIAGEEKNVDLSFWLTRVGSYYTPIHVFRGQEFLFEVPPLFDNTNSGAKKAASDSDSIFEDAITAQNRERNNPSAGSQYIEQALKSRHKEDAPEGRLNYAKQINSILARYKKPLIDEDLGLPDGTAAPETSQEEQTKGLYDDPNSVTYDALPD